MNVHNLLLFILISYNYWPLLRETCEKAYGIFNSKIISIGIKYYDRRCIYSLYKNQTVLVHIDGKEKEAKIKKVVRQGCNVSQDRI